MSNKKTLLTGASGFLGGAVMARLPSSTHVLGRNAPALKCNFFKTELDDKSDYLHALKGVEAVIHCAARAHVMKESAQVAIDAYRKVNVFATLRLAKHAACSGVERFVFVSSVKVNGELTLPGVPFRYDDPAMPADPYGASKAEAEEGLVQVAKETGMELVIIRPPLVYGPGVKANFATMMKLAQKNLPLPLGALRNRRSLVALDNLVDLIITCVDHPKAAGQTFLVSDDHDVSTTELLEVMTKAAGKKPRLLPVPASWLRFVGRLTGNQAVIDRLCGNLQVDISHTKNTLDWKPPVFFEDGIKRCFSGD